MKDIKPRMTSVNIDSRMVKKILDRSIHVLIVIFSLLMASSLMMVHTKTTQAMDTTLTSTISSTFLISQTDVVPFTLTLSPTIATVDNTGNIGLNLRKGPGQEHPPRVALWQDEQVTVQGTNDEDCQWVYITRAKNPYVGWVYSGYLRDSQRKLISEECPPIIEPEVTTTNPTTAIDDQHERSNNKDGSLLERYRMLAIGIVALLLTALLYWIAYTKGFLSRLRQSESPAGIPANSKIPKAGTPYLEAMLISAQPIYCPLNDKNISIGRNKENTLVIDSRFAQWDTVSSHHARIEQDRDSFIITDLDSKNGVFVDGRRTQENILYDGMQVSLGKVAFVFRVNGK